MTTVLSLPYLPNTYWMRCLLTKNCVIDLHEHFIKQTFRNRAIILGPNGPQDLIIPVQKTDHKIPMYKLMANDQTDWKRTHWGALKAAYGSSPFYPHYAPKFEKIFTQKQEGIAEFNLQLIQLILDLLHVDGAPILSQQYILPSEQIEDLRNKISPKTKLNEHFKPYLQVFSSKYPFIENLSVVDVLFNQGTNALNYIL